MATSRNTLRDELQALCRGYKAAPYVQPPLEDVDALYRRVRAACRERAAAGCSTLGFHWGEATTSSRVVWEARKIVVEEVARRLRSESLDVDLSPTRWPDPTVNPWTDETEAPQDVSFRLTVSWCP